MPSQRVTFCVVERPYAVHGYRLKDDNIRFLDQFDTEFYGRVAKMIVAHDFESDSENTDDDSKERRDASALARMIWFHGAETLTTLLGAFLQAPSAVNAYFLKCRTDDVVDIASTILRERGFRYMHVEGGQLTIDALIRLVHSHAVWSQDDKTISNFSSAVRTILEAIALPHARAEYNSLKHGARAAHGGFTLSVGVEEIPGVEPSSDAMNVIGSTKDSSAFGIAIPLKNSETRMARPNFVIEDVTVAWSLEKVLCEIQLMGTLVSNLISRIRVANGVDFKTVKFTRPIDEDGWWEKYLSLNAGSIISTNWRVDVDASQICTPTADEIYASYNQQRVQE